MYKIKKNTHKTMNKNRKHRLIIPRLFEIDLGCEMLKKRQNKFARVFSAIAIHLFS